MAKKDDKKPLAPRKMEENLTDIIQRYEDMFPDQATEPHRQCMNCRKTKSLRQYYITKNPFMTNRRIGICKDCIEKKVDFFDFGEAQYFLLLMHLPFVEEGWQNALKTPTPVGNYMKMMNLGQYAKLDPMTIQRVQSYGQAYQKDPYQQKLEDLTDEERGYLQAKWGYHYDLMDCLKLEEYAEQMMEDYDIETRSHTDYLQKIAKTSLIVDEMIKEGDHKGVKDMTKTLDDLMKSAGFSQSSKSKDSKKEEGFSAFGYLFEMAEKRGFIPQYHNEEDPDIVDKTIKNLKLWTQNLVRGEQDLETLMESAAQRILEQEKNEKEIKNKADDYSELEEFDQT